MTPRLAIASECSTAALIPGCVIDLLLEHVVHFPGDAQSTSHGGKLQGGRPGSARVMVDGDAAAKIPVGIPVSGRLTDHGDDLVPCVENVGLSKRVCAASTIRVRSD